MKNLKYSALAIFTVLLTSLFTIGCGEDSVAPPNNGGGSAPNINMKLNSLYGFTNDSLDTNGTTVRPTRLRTMHSYLAQGTFFGQSNAFQILAETRDTTPSGGLVSLDTFYVRYEGGKFYQYGMVRLIDSTQPPTWDLVADFTVATGTSWHVATISTVIGGFAVTTDINAKVAEQTPFITNNTNQSINNYRVEITGNVNSAFGNLGTVTVDYYIGYADPATNPSGMVRLKIRPVWLRLPPPLNTTVFRAAGVDQKISYYVIP